jgi:hypothetical protein
MIDVKIYFNDNLTIPASEYWDDKIAVVYQSDLVSLEKMYDILPLWQDDTLQIAGVEFAQPDQRMWYGLHEDDIKLRAWKNCKVNLLKILERYADNIRGLMNRTFDTHRINQMFDLGMDHKIDRKMEWHQRDLIKALREIACLKEVGAVEYINQGRVGIIRNPEELEVIFSNIRYTFKQYKECQRY